MADLSVNIGELQMNNPRKITEIRIFFDDNTYETFKPEN